MLILPELHSVYEFDEFLDEFPSFALKIRWQVFTEKGNRCIRCGIEGTHVITWAEKRYVPGTRYGLHTDLFAINHNLMMMTMDHRLPKSRGGGKTLENLDPMCQRCNQQKANNAPDYLPVEFRDGIRVNYKSYPDP